MDICYASLGYIQIPSVTLAASTSLASLAPSTAYNATTGLWTAQAVLLRAEAQNIRWRDDGTAPTATVGQLLLPGDPPFFYPVSPGALQFIYATAGGILNVTFLK